MTRPGAAPPALPMRAFKGASFEPNKSARAAVGIASPAGTIVEGLAGAALALGFWLHFKVRSERLIPCFAAPASPAASQALQAC
jgi:hypothetical protein